MYLAQLKQIFEKKEEKDNKLYKFCSFEWILDLLKHGKVYSYEKPLRDQKIKDKNEGWIALTTKRSSAFNQLMDDYGPCEVRFDKELLKLNNDLYKIKLNPDWLDERPSILKFITKGKYSSSKDYFKDMYKNIDWNNPDNYSKRFFKDYFINGELDVDKLLDENKVSDIEDYIYDLNYVPFENYIRSIGDEEELVLVKSPLKLVNDAITEIIVPRRYKDKIQKYELEYKIRYD